LEKTNVKNNFYKKATGLSEQPRYLVWSKSVAKNKKSISRNLTSPSVRPDKPTA